MRELLRVEIVQELRRGDLLPSEWELVSSFNASRGVVRAALELLRDEGLIDRLQGAGTFVVSPSREIFAIDELGGMTKNIDEFDARARWELLEYESVKAPPLIAERLGIAAGADVLHAERRGIFDGEPLLIRSSWIPRRVADLLSVTPASERWSADDLVEKAIGPSIDRTYLRVEATIVDTSTADALGMPEGSPLVLLERLVVDVAGRPVEYGHSPRPRRPGGVDDGDAPARRDSGGTLTGPRGRRRHLQGAQRPRAAALPQLTRPLGRGHLTPGWFYGTVAFGSVGMAMTAPMTVLFAKQLGASDAVATVIVASITVSFLCLDLVASRVVPRVDARAALAGGYLVFGIGSWASALAPNLTVMAGARIVQGFAAAFPIGAAFRVSLRLARPGGQAAALARFNASSFVGLTVGPLAAGVIAAAVRGESGIRWAFGVCGFVNVAAAAIALVVLPRTPSTERPQFGLPSRTRLRRPSDPAGPTGRRARVRPARSGGRDAAPAPRR